MKMRATAKCPLPLRIGGIGRILGYPIGQFVDLQVEFHHNPSIVLAHERLQTPPCP
jgi:hypothetical protein